MQEPQVTYWRVTLERNGVREDTISLGATPDDVCRDCHRQSGVRLVSMWRMETADAVAEIQAGSLTDPPGPYADESDEWPSPDDGPEI